LGDLWLYSGQSFRQLGQLNLPQLRSALAAVNRRRKEQIEMMGGTVQETAKPDANLALGLEHKLAMLKARTGRTKFDLREVI
jgi:hypothetical protein